jgi:hypothetical protein
MIKVTPGSAEAISFTVRNQGTKVEEFRCAVTGPAWIAAEPAAMSVYPGQEATGTVQAAPPRTPGSRAGVTPFRLTVTSAVHENVSGSVAGRVDVAPYFDLAAELVPTSSTGRGLTRHSVRLDNRGNAPLRVMLRATDIADGLRVGVPPYADVPPGTVSEVPVGVQGARQWLGRPLPKNFSVIAEAPKPLAPARLPGTRVVLPEFPSWVPVAAGLVIAAGAASGLVVPRLLASTHPLVSATPASVTVSTTPNSGPSTQVTSAPSSGATSATSASSSVSSSTSTTQDTSSSSTTTSSSPSGPMYDLTSLASSLSTTWTSVSINGTHTVAVQQNLSGCQVQGAAVYGLSQVVLEDGTLAPTALEIVPFDHPSSSMTGVYTLPTPTTAGEVFSAQAGFCYGVPSTTQMQYAVGVGAQPPAQYQTIDGGTGQLGTVSVPLPAGTTQVTLKVINGSPGTTSGGVFWVDPVIEGPNGPAPSPRVTVSPG